MPPELDVANAMRLHSASPPPTSPAGWRCSSRTGCSPGTRPEAALAW